MHDTRLSRLSRLLRLVALLLIAKVTFSVVAGYRNYVPPDFESDFLRGRDAYFFGAYGVAFYAHLIAGPASLVIGTILLSDRLRHAAPVWHRRLGRVQATCVLLVLVPSGLIMARHAAGGAVAAAGLATLAIATAACVLLGWKAAVSRKFSSHSRWMGRVYMLLLSAVVIRLIGGVATVAEFHAEWLYPLSTWVSWLAPLVIYEVAQQRGRRAAERPQVEEVAAWVAAK